MEGGGRVWGTACACGVVVDSPMFHVHGSAGTVREHSWTPVAMRALPRATRLIYRAAHVGVWQCEREE